MMKLIYLMLMLSLTAASAFANPAQERALLNHRIIQQEIQVVDGVLDDLELGDLRLAMQSQLAATAIVASIGGVWADIAIGTMGIIVASPIPVTTKVLCGVMLGGISEIGILPFSSLLKLDRIDPRQQAQNGQIDSSNYDAARDGEAALMKSLEAHSLVKPREEISALSRREKREYRAQLAAEIAQVLPAFKAINVGIDRAYEQAIAERDPSRYTYFYRIFRFGRDQSEYGGILILKLLAKKRAYQALLALNAEAATQLKLLSVR